MYFIKKITKFPLILFIFIFSHYSHAQSILSFCDKDDIAGFYCPEWSYGIEFRTDGRMKMSRKNFNEEEVISGKWEKRNDTIFVEFDTTHCSVIATNFCVTGLYCTSFVRDDDIILHVYYKYLDRQLNYRAYIKTACFYATDSLKIESKYTLFGNIFTTTYYENGKVDEIKECFNDKKNEILKSGICLKYDTIGRLVIYQQWDKGKKIYEKKFNYTTLDTINSNEIKKRINKHGRFIVTRYKNGKVDEIKEFLYNRRHGIYLKYNSRGMLSIYQQWRKGKMIHNDIFAYGF